LSKKALILGNTGFLGKHVERLATDAGWATKGLSLSGGFDLRSPEELNGVVDDFNPSVIINCAANVGGLSYSRGLQATILADNVRMVLALFDFMSTHTGIRLVNPIANCAYPGSLGSFHEGDFWEGSIHPSVLGYGGARRLSVLASEAYREQFAVEAVDVALPNLYGPGDHLDPVRAHALGGLVSRILSAAANGLDEVSIWGSGRPIREWLYVEDAARALILAAETESPPNFVNVGTGEGVSIAQLAEMIANAVGYDGRLIFDPSLPDGAAEKRMVADRAEQDLGWRPQYSLEQGLAPTVADARERLTMDSGSG
jgi:GDP-L-fucose synthase